MEQSPAPEPTVTADGKARWRFTGSVLVAVTAVFLAATARLLVWPSTDEVGARSADAVVVLAGGGPRFTTGQALAKRGVAPVLVVSDGGEAHWPAVEEACTGPADHEVRCVTPEPATTRGEARAVGALAAHRDLEELVVVTSASHLARAELLVERCVDADVRRVAADESLARRLSPDVVAHEWAGLAHAWLVDRGC